MTVALVSVGFVILLWWSATGAVFWLDRRTGASSAWTIAGATLVVLASLVGLGLTSQTATPAAAYVAFACAIGVWGWNELLFLSGVVTGPNRRPAEAGVSGWARFRAAAASVMHHEVVLLASGAAVAAVTIGGQNHVGLCAFMTLWIMRLSAKLNIFVGVPNPGERFLPEKIRYLAGHFRTRPVGLFFAVTFTVSSLAFAGIALFGVGEAPSDFEIASVALISTLLGLAVIEHVFLALPWDSGRLWGALAANDNSRGGAAKSSAKSSVKSSAKPSATSSATSLATNKTSARAAEA